MKAIPERGPKAPVGVITPSGVVPRDGREPGRHPARSRHRPNRPTSSSPSGRRRRLAGTRSRSPRRPSACRSTLPTTAGKYRLTVVLHDADGVAYDAVTQAMIPSLIVRVTGDFDGDIQAAANGRPDVRRRRRRSVSASGTSASRRGARKRSSRPRTCRAGRPRRSRQADRSLDPAHGRCRRCRPTRRTRRSARTCRSASRPASRSTPRCRSRHRRRRAPTCCCSTWSPRMAARSSPRARTRRSSASRPGGGRRP